MRILLSSLLMYLLFVHVVMAAPASGPDWTETEQWAWEQIVSGNVADFNTYCNEPPEWLERWRNPCRMVSARFIEDALTKAPWKAAIPHQGLRLMGAYVQGGLDLENAHVESAFCLDDSFISGSVAMAGSRWDGPISLAGTEMGEFDASSASFWRGIVLSDGTNVAGELQFGGATIAGDLDMNGSHFKAVAARSLKIQGNFQMSKSLLKGDLNLVGATIGGDLDMNDSFFQAVAVRSLKVQDNFLMSKSLVEGDLNLVEAVIGGDLDMSGSDFQAVDANRLTVKGSLFLNGKSCISGELMLVGAYIGGFLDMNSSSFQTVIADGLTVKGSLFLNERASVDSELRLVGANIGRSLGMDNSSFQVILADRLTVNGSLFLREKTNVAGVLGLSGAYIGGFLDMGSSSFQAVSADRLTIKGNLFLCREARVSENMIMRRASIGALNLSNAEFLGTVDLSGTAIAGDLTLGSGTNPPPRWLSGSHLVLRNVNAGALQDALPTGVLEDRSEGWPEKVELGGFTYSRLGGVDECQDNEAMLKRDVKWYLKWLAKDENTGPQPYRQLSMVLSEAGEDDKATKVLVAYRDKEREELWKDLGWFDWRWLDYIWLTSLCVFINYGLGNYLGRILLWVLLFTALGTVVLSIPGPNMSQPPKTLPWRVLASFDHLLPIVKLSPEFDDYFEDPDRKRLYTLQIYYFCFQALIGFILGFFLVAALSGVTQGY
ncbi:hypothetical protein [Desulfocurvibacter africanus]|uniref:Membrane-associated oxidoreductase n=1 Tax=Desulfocurvibacter africanus subsp. africanus str. Walvis Bay TaxID=690850 RepID=F3YXG6_DESAF|nr:hypothetical protein [Desulfocurvibacter africanus]EGJ51743.1 hypothetical protein Desaf_3459 [Desulfocurvibacter africanus subsp. africanus str. Walvis Bay]